MDKEVKSIEQRRKEFFEKIKNQKKEIQHKIKEKLENKEIDIIIGTHALFSKYIKD